MWIGSKCAVNGCLKKAILSSYTLKLQVKAMLREIIYAKLKDTYIFLISVSSCP